MTPADTLAPPRTSYIIPPGQRFVLRTADWNSYRAFIDLLGESHVRLTYDRGNLELMTLSHFHEWLSKLIGRLVEALTEELDLPLHSAGSTTLDREDLDRGLEPDQCYYLENEPRVRGRDQIDLRTDPPPDLAIEVEVSRTALNRLSIYAALGIPEVWRFDGETLHVLRLSESGTYEETERSPHFPFLPLSEVIAVIGRRHEMSETSLLRSFRAWVREQIPGGWQLPT